MKGNKKIKKKGRILFLISCVLLILIAIVLVYFTFYYKSEEEKNDENDKGAVTSIDFTKCTEGTCEYKVELNDKIYRLKYVNLDEPEGENLDAILSKLYLNNKVIINVLQYDRVLDMNILNDLLVFGKHRGTSPEGQYIEVFNSAGTKLSKINVLDEERNIVVSEAYEICLSKENVDNMKISDYFYKINGNILEIYGTRYTNSWEIEIGGRYYFIHDMSELISSGKISSSDIFTAKYEITYDELKNGDAPKLKEVIQTVGEVAKVFED